MKLEIILFTIILLIISRWTRADTIYSKLSIDRFSSWKYFLQKSPIRKNFELVDPPSLLFFDIFEISQSILFPREIRNETFSEDFSEIRMQRARQSFAEIW